MVINIINGLGTGGAEKSLLKIIKNDKLNSHIVISLTNVIDMRNDFKLHSKKIKIYNLKSIKAFFYIFKIIKIIKKYKPSRINLWMYNSCALGIILRFFTSANQYWFIRHAKILDPEVRLKFLAFVLGMFSYLIPKKIIYNSNSSMRSHIKENYFSQSRSVVIHNGFETHKTAYINKIKKDIIKFIVIGRNHYDKGYDVLLDALKIVDHQLEKSIEIQIFGTDTSNKSFFTKFGFVSSGYNKISFKFGGISEKISSELKKADYLILPSRTESFPNVVCEAMTNGVPCITTPVGDVKLIVQSNGFIASDISSQSLAKKILEAIYIYNNEFEEYLALRKNGFDNVRKNFSMEKQIQRIEEEVVD